MKVLVTGSSGLVGSALTPFLADKGHEVVRLVRREPRAGASEVRWDPGTGFIDSARLGASRPPSTWPARTWPPEGGRHGARPAFLKAA